MKPNMSRYKQVTEKKLIEIKKNGRPFILECYEGTEEIPKLWLFHDVTTFSYILVIRSYNVDRKRNFNHIVIDDSLPNLTIAGNLEKAIKKIGEGKCFAWQSNGNFAQLDECNMPHC
ncbi:hypothetical protein FOG18_02620 [Legionella israelensis]|uniref:hypothetical protein n=1 Tax=Legionella israelensis TaxID=454 RepID=UPI00117ED8E3|nr:hypothetical protein [Legionella israelensis]QDP71544.1 hypothetical protein FOG18_02620 [Legionella israelensis]